MRSALFACLAALGAAACLEEEPQQAGAPSPPASETGAAAPESGALAQTAQAPAGPAPVDSEIDWEAARSARSQGAVTDAPVSVQQVGQDAPVPVLLPSGIVQPQNAPPPTIVATEDGYFATYQTPKYDAIVNGTKQAFVTPAGAGAPEAGDDMRFTTGDGSAQMAFSRFGADYLIEFECRELDGEESCVTEEEARAFAESLFVASTR